MSSKDKVTFIKVNAIHWDDGLDNPEEVLCVYLVIFILQRNEKMQ